MGHHRRNHTLAHTLRHPALQCGTGFVDIHFDGFKTSTLLYVAIGQASLKAVYSYLGYYNVCHLGAEIKDPARNIPRSIIISITGIAIFYLGMQTIILGVLPWQTIAGSDFVASIYFEHIYNHAVAQVATLLILVIALASLFSAILGYSRIPYAAAQNGDFFSVFAKVHPKHKFPHISLLAVGSLGFIFSLLFKLGDAITAILTMRILAQFVSQGVGVIGWHYFKRDDPRPYKMPLFPYPGYVLALASGYLYTPVSGFSSFCIHLALSGSVLSPTLFAISTLSVCQHRMNY